MLISAYSSANLVSRVKDVLLLMHTVDAVFGDDARQSENVPRIVRMVPDRKQDREGLIATFALGG